MIKISLYIFFLFLFSLNASHAKCVGKFINPITDICWSCIFPISIGPTKISSGKSNKDTSNPKDIICSCVKPLVGIQIGVPIGLWEPVRLIDVTRTPYCMVSMGGIEIFGNKKGISSTEYNVEDRGLNSGFYHAHIYNYPVISWLDILMDFVCLEKGSFDVAFMTELDPTWNDDELSAILNPEVAMYANPIAQTACVADCLSSTTSLGIDSLHWCAGCNGSFYPFVGTVSYMRGGVHASTLLSGRLIAKLHRTASLPVTSGKKAMCEPYVDLNIKKSQYKLQMVYPKAAKGVKACNPLGESEALFGEFKEFPYKGEDWSYILWRKRNCCAL